LLIDRREEFPDVALEHPNRFRMISAFFVRVSPESVHSPVRSFSKATRVRVTDEDAIEEWIELAVESVMDEPIAHARFVDVARLRVGYFEMFISTMTIGARSEVVMKLKYILHQMSFKFLHIPTLPLPSHEFLPRIE
jgi:hypothetical protein